MIYKVERIQKDNGNYEHYDKFFVQMDDSYILNEEELLNDICCYEHDAFKKAFPDENNFTFRISNICSEDIKEMKSIKFRYAINDLSTNLVLFGIRNKETGELVNLKSKGNKFFTRRSDAIAKCSKNHEVVRYKLIEMEDNE